MFRRSFLVPFGLLLFGLTVVPACRKKEAAPDPSAPPAAVKSDYVAFAHIDTKQIRDGDLFAEIRQAFTKAGGAAEWNEVEKGFASQTGFKPSDVDAVTVCVTDVTERDGPQLVLIVKANTAIPKNGAFGIKKGTEPDADGFYIVSHVADAHFPDDKTLVVLTRSLRKKYLDGYAKDRAGWPLTPDLSKAAAGHTLFAHVQLDKLPNELKNGREMGDIAPLLAARSVTVTGNLKDKALVLAGRAAFADANAAGKAKDKGQEFIKIATDEVAKFLKRQGAEDLGPLLAAVKEADRALAAAKLEVSGSDVTLVADYKADFDFGTMVVEGAKKVREAAARMKVSNNLKMIGLALHNFHDSNTWLPIHGTGASGTKLTKATDKPLLSWRVALLPYIEQDALYKQFKLDEPWDSENNKKLIEKMPNIYAPVQKPGKPGYTNLQMVIGPKAMPPLATTLVAITDGTSNTLAVVDAAEPVIWTKPDDVMLPEKEFPKDLKKKFGGQFKGGFQALFWDGSVRFIADTIDEKTLRALITPAGGEVIGGY
ncbi:DUF1559 domain-containing protein [Gemmata sp. JC673]|uniref:DUF1559 domain-containing protein n=1 Tax=Gemmata algarum TaxID=2975278 RepID=A0ABU5F2G2_9BACT|nr:DUF1559 domain-containing protein [Gemmata algarum]MDY3560997.1 DUF1559 domain-containing protein [Gemmata algarum]